MRFQLCLASEQHNYHDNKQQPNCRSKEAPRLVLQAQVTKSGFTRSSAGIQQGFDPGLVVCSVIFIPEGLQFTFPRSNAPTQVLLSPADYILAWL